MNLKPRADFDKHKENFLWYSFTENKMILSSFQIRCMYKRYSMSRFIYLETIPLCTNITALNLCTCSLKNIYVKLDDIATLLRIIVFYLTENSCKFLYDGEKFK